MRAACFVWAALLGVAPLSTQAQQITHGPILGRPGATEMGVWARTDRPGEFRVRFGAIAGELDGTSSPVSTTVDHDNTGWAHLTGLRPATTYFYEVVTGTAQARPIGELSGSFTTLPSAGAHRHPVHNPDGLFNFSFEYACGNRQPGDGAQPAFGTMLSRLKGSVDFAILNGDFIYEQRRDYPVADWLEQVGRPAGPAPRTVDLAPAIFFVIDTRSHRELHDIADPFAPDVSVLGDRQKAWLQEAMRSSTARTRARRSSCSTTTA